MRGGTFAIVRSAEGFINPLPIAPKTFGRAGLGGARLTSSGGINGLLVGNNSGSGVNDTMLNQVSEDRLEEFAKLLRNKYKALYQLHCNRESYDRFFDIGDDNRRDQIHPDDSDIESYDSAY
ncbi:hypothetical protein V498_08091 [Pseudogymnoascus sp. VKM F-4517 (FW-2822)]|nr:hypothetical protein V498_08091 [Pseudogymnoascus sp. VKM F-4517 (FW-2822)]